MRQCCADPGTMAFRSFQSRPQIRRNSLANFTLEYRDIFIALPDVLLVSGIDSGALDVIWL